MMIHWRHTRRRSPSAAAELRAPRALDFDTHDRPFQQIFSPPAARRISAPLVATLVVFLRRAPLLAARCFPPAAGYRAHIALSQELPRYMRAAPAQPATASALCVSRHDCFYPQTRASFDDASARIKLSAFARLQMPTMIGRFRGQSTFEHLSRRAR